MRVARSAAACACTSANWSWLDSCCFSAWASWLRLRELIQLQSQRRGLIGLPLRLGFGRRQFLLRLFGIVLQLPVQIFDVGLRGGDLLLQLLVFLLALAGRVAGLRQLLLQLLAGFCCSSAERLFHHGGQVVAGIRDGIGRDHDLRRRRRVFVGHVVDVRRKRQQTQQQEVADDDEDAAVHDSRQGLTRPPAEHSPVGGRVPASASSNNFRRAGRRWKILKMTTKMMPNDVEEYAAIRLNLTSPSEARISEMMVPTKPR